MFVTWLYFINLFFIVPNVLCNERVPCDFNDVPCITAAVRILFKKAMAGDPVHNITSSDPLYRDKIEAFLPHMNITLNNAYMHGMKSCDVHRLRMTTNEYFLSYICPKMTLESDYEINGDVDSVHIEGAGRCEIIYEKYFIGLYGGYETYTGENGKEYFNATFYKIDFTYVQGRVIYNFSNLFNGDKEKSMEIHKYINGDWKKLYDIIGETIIYSLYGYFVDNINKHLALIPKYELFYKSL